MDSQVLGHFFIQLLYILDVHEPRVRPPHSLHPQPPPQMPKQPPPDGKRRPQTQHEDAHDAAHDAVNDVVRRRSVSRSRDVRGRACCVRCCCRSSGSSGGSSGGAHNYTVEKLPAVAAILYISNTGVAGSPPLGDFHAVVDVHLKARLNRNGGSEPLLADEPCLRSGQQHHHHHHRHHHESIESVSVSVVHPENKILLVL